jgi:ELWxxDGT repeat protein
MVKDLPEDYYYLSIPRELTGVAGTLFFISGEDQRGYGGNLWKSDGTEAGTVRLRTFTSGGYGARRNLTGVGGTLFFTAAESHGDELWKSDGTEAGTIEVRDINPNDFCSSSPSSLTDVGDTLFFTADDGIHGRELWKSDGTRSGTVRVKDIDPDDEGYDSGPSSLTDVGGRLFFSADDGAHGRELWKSDGTWTGTVLVKDINKGGGFTVPWWGTADTSTGTLKVRVEVSGPGRLVVGPVDGSELKWSVQDVARAGTTTVTLRPTWAGLAILKKVGWLRVKARFTFTPCGGTGTSVIRGYTLRLR